MPLAASVTSWYGNCIWHLPRCRPNAQQREDPRGARKTSNGGEPVTGHTKQYPDASTQERDPHRHSGWHFDYETTRYLSANTQKSIAYARLVVKRIINEPFRALPPTYGVDVAVVARWAVDAVRRRGRRDSRIALVLVLGIFTCCMFGTLLPLSNWIPAILALAILSTFVIVSHDYWTRTHKIIVRQMLRERFDPSAAPDPPDQRIRARLASIKERRAGNLIVFRNHTAFAGSGRRIARKHMLIEITDNPEPEDDDSNLTDRLVGGRGFGRHMLHRVNGDGHTAKGASPTKTKLSQPADTDREPSAEKPRFTVPELHKELVDELNKFTGIGFADMKAEERLFVNGRHIHGNTDFLLTPFGPPQTSVDPELLELAAQRPTPDARSYVCAEFPSWRGQLVVTMFARAVYTGRLLFVEWTFHVLPPLQSKLLEIDQLHTVSPAGQVIDTLLAGIKEMPSALLKSSFDAVRCIMQPTLDRRLRKAQER